MPAPQRPIILDASCLLNLYASRKLREVAEILPQPLAVAEYVVQQEALYIRRRASEQEPEEREPVDMRSLVAAGLIQVITLNSEAEAATFVDLASEMDDGEAMTCALAIHRGCDVATDDRKARRVLSGRASHVAIISTLAIVKQWAELAGIAKAELKATLLNIWSGAHYYPGEREPLYAWWVDILS
jgi:predicted nucleic acid-binding protein